MDEVTALISELRALFTHTPLSPTDLLTYAPNLCRSLHPTDPEQSLVQLWEVFDAFPGDQKVAAAAAMLGLTVTGNVLERQVAFAEEKNPRTVRRWAYDGIEKVAIEISRRFTIIYADCSLHVTGSADRVVVSFALDTNVNMEQLRTDLWQYPKDDAADIDMSVIEGADGLELERADWREWSFSTAWNGEAVPSWRLMSNLTLDVFTMPGRFSVASSWL